MRTLLFASLALISSCCLLPAQSAAPRLKDETRALWSRGDNRFIRHWLVSSELPLADGFEKDWLSGQGGEAAIRPTEKRVDKLANGAKLEWRAVVSWGDETDLSNGTGLKRDLVAYAFATVHRAEASKALLSLGSDESARVWLNGALVLDRRTARPQTFDEDRVEVDMQAGDNALLVKSEQRQGPWTISARVLDLGATPPRVQEIGPSARESTPDALIVTTDATAARAALDKVTVQVVGAGGKVFAEKTAARGERLNFNPSGWPDGAYEVRCATHRPNGLLWATHLPWYKGDAVAAARRLVAAAQKADLQTPDGLTLKMLGDMALDRLDAKDLSKVTGNPWWAVHSPLMEFEEMQLEAQGVAARVRPYGFVRLAYRDDTDGSPQFCRAYLPGGYDPAKKWPLVVKLHGYNPANPEYVRWWAADSRHHALADVEYAGRQGIIYIEPHGRGNTSYLGLGDQDVVRAIRLAKERFNVDEDRVYLSGDSMGGWGTWNVAARHPELFAAISPIFGGVDYHSVLSEEDLAKLTPLDRYLQEAQSSWAMADSLLNMPILVHHGDVDHSVNVEYSRYGVRLLQRWGYNVRYDEHPGYGHEDLNVMGDTIDWFLEHRREANPNHVRVRSTELKNASAYWAKIDRAERPDRFMELDAEIVDPNSIRLDTRNALEVTLAPVSALIDPHQPVLVNWNGAPRQASFEDGRLRLRAAGYTPAALEKNSAVAGPLGDVFNAPFAIVQGTSASDPAMREVCRSKAEALAGLWQDWQRQPARVFKDSELSDADAARYSLVLIGGADANSITRKLAGGIPLKVSSDRIEIGGRSFPASDARVEMIYPSPLNRQRYVVVIAATSPGGMFFVTPEELRSATYDFTVQDGHVATGHARASASDLAVVGGWFGRSWQVDPNLYHEGDAAARSKSMLLHPPKPGGSIDAKILDTYVGKYEVAPNLVVVVERKGSRLMTQVAGQPQVELLPVSDTEFFVLEGPAQVAVEKDAAGKVVAVKITQNGQQFRARKIE